MSKAARPRKQDARWSQRVTRSSNALDLEEGVFTLDDPRAIAESLRRSAEASMRRRAGAFQSAMSMLTFYVNRAGRGLEPARRAVLEAAKDELRVLYGRAPRRTSGAGIATPPSAEVAYGPRGRGRSGRS